jgi:hypothetical protein
VTRYTEFRNYVLSLKDGSSSLSMQAAAAEFTKQQRRMSKAAARPQSLAATAAAAVGAGGGIAAAAAAGGGDDVAVYAAGVDNSFAALIQETKQRMATRIQEKQQGQQVQQGIDGVLLGAHTEQQQQQHEQWDGVESPAPGQPADVAMAQDQQQQYEQQQQQRELQGGGPEDVPQSCHGDGQQQQQHDSQRGGEGGEVEEELEGLSDFDGQQQQQVGHDEDARLQALCASEGGSEGVGLVVPESEQEEDDCMQ